MAPVCARGLGMCGSGLVGVHRRLTGGKEPLLGQRMVNAARGVVLLIYNPEIVTGDRYTLLIRLETPFVCLLIIRFFKPLDDVVWAFPPLPRAAQPLKMKSTELLDGTCVPRHPPKG